MPSREQINFNAPEGMRDELHAAARANNRSLNSEIIHRLQAHEGVTGDADMADDKLVYTPPPGAADEMSRRVYNLPVDLVKRIHEYGHENGHPSEVSAVRELLDAALAKATGGQ